ncbi:MAG: TonB-dependent receptor, partial [Chitinophagaceae bacterium]|nr:TonB-dependent receptor [Chitinophagaceae bacterium]
NRGAAMAGNPLVDPSNYFLDPKRPKQSYIIQQVMNQEGGAYYDALTRNALMMQHNVTVSGAADRASYLLSLGYLDQEGTVVNSYMRRYNVRINTMYKIREGIRIGENVNLQYRNNPNGNNNSTVPANGAFGPIEAGIKQVPFLPVYDIAGNFGGPFASPATGEAGDWGNAVATATLNGNNRNREYGIAGNAYLEIDFLKHFMFKTVFGGSINNYYRQQYKPRAYWNRNGQENDEYREYTGYNSNAQWTNTLNYKNSFGRHNLNVLVGTEAVETKYRQLYGRGDGFYLDTYQYLVLQQATVRQPASNGDGDPKQYNGEDALSSIIGRIDYNFNDKVLATVTGRRDGYSRFGSDNQYGTFYSVGLGWRISQENFMKNVAWVNDLKLRASYGELGNKEPVPISNAYSTYTLNNRTTYYDINGTTTSTVPGFSPLTYGNSKTSWENNKQTNIGFDATLFNNKFDISAEYFIKRTDGLIQTLQFPASAGEATSPSINLGDIENKGVDITTTYHARMSKDFNMNFGVNFTMYKNKILSLPDPGYVQSGRVRYAEGQEMGAFYGYKIVGIAREQKDLDDSPVQQDK